MEPTKDKINFGINLITISQKIDLLEADIEKKKDELDELTYTVNKILSDTNKYYYKIMKNLRN